MERRAPESKDGIVVKAHRSRHRANIAQAILVPTLLCLLCTACAGAAVPVTGTPIPSSPASGELLVTPTGTPPAPTAVSQEAIATLTTLSTSAPRPVPSFAPPTMDVLDAKVATIQAEQVERATRLAGPVLTPIPRRYPLATPHPINTPIPGFDSWCTGGNSIRFDGSCWSGQINGEYLFVTTEAATQNHTNSWVTVYTTTLDLRTFGPRHEYYPPGHPGLLYMAQVNWPHVILTTEIGSPGHPAPVRQFGFNLVTRDWEAPGPCPLVPLTVAADALRDMHNVGILTTTVTSSLTDTVGWLTWTGDPSDEALVRSLTPPGNGSSYRNPDNPDDHTLTAGKWVRGRIPATAGAGRAALAELAAQHFKVVVPLWDQVTGQGSERRYHISGFAWVFFPYDDMVGAPQLSISYWAPAICPADP
jgi:hypothetical protein